ncbi:MAG: DNA internalization-related competence protein ComEC/Rec2 [Clostridia bacterium]|nr:DNA internalization-related competence protein ComEC/Rec2 [Clostridia bacterium]
MSARKTVDSLRSAEMRGRVSSEPFINPQTQRCVFRFDLDTVNGEASDLRVRLYIRSDDGAPMEHIEYGQQLHLTGHLWAPAPVTNPDEFDFGAWLYRQGMDAYATAKVEDVAVTGTDRDLVSGIIQIRRSLSGRIERLFGKSAGIMQALVLGNRSMLSDELRTAMSRSGVAHLISISGLHVTVLAGLLAFILSLFMPRRIASVAAAALLIPYGAMIGFTASFTRALVMFAVLSFAPIAGLPSDPVTRLCAALLGWLLVDPLSIADAGFVLSYSATAGILLLMSPLMDLLGVKALSARAAKSSPVSGALCRLAVYLLTLLAASLSAQLATLPAVVAFFGVQSVLSVPFNLLCVPLCMLGYLTGLAAILISFLPLGLAFPVAAAADYLLGLLLKIVRLSSLIPTAAIRIGRYPPLLAVLHGVILFAASDLSLLRPGIRRFLPIAIIAIAALSSSLILIHTWRTAVVFLDAGQADCAIVRSKGHTFVVDTGDTYTPVGDYLNATCLHLDGILLTHPHEDHAGGLSDILSSFRPDAIYIPKGWFEVEDIAPSIADGIRRAQEMGVPIREVIAGDSIKLSDGIRFDIFSPLGGAVPEDVNDLSILALAECSGKRVLFTGDLSTVGEPVIIPDTDVLKVAHHGSSKATSTRFLAACTPEIAVISVGENNYGHPAQTTLDKLNACGARIFETLQSGAITMTLRQGAWQIDTFREVRNELE